MTINDLMPGETANIEALLNLPANIAKKLRDLGMTHGERITFLKRAPFGDPVWIEVRGYQLAFSVAIAKEVAVIKQQGVSAR